MNVRRIKKALLVSCLLTFGLAVAAWAMTLSSKILFVSGTSDHGCDVGANEYFETNNCTGIYKFQVSHIASHTSCQNLQSQVNVCQPTML